jgi:hypothetical protein
MQLTLQSPSEEFDVRCLIRRDPLNIGIDSRVEAGGGKVRLGEIGQSFAVEPVLEMLQCESIVENVGCANIFKSATKVPVRQDRVHHHVPSVGA